MSIAYEQRVQTRVAAVLPVRFESLESLLEAYTENISAGGLFVQTEEFLPIGAVVHLKIGLHDTTSSVDVMARVSHVLGVEEALQVGRKPGMGFEFLDSGGVPAANRIAEYLAVKLEESSAATADVPAATIVVVDDNDLARERTGRAMEVAGHRVLLATNGMDALGVTLKAKPDLVLTDAEMPVMNGWQFVRLLRARASIAGTPVIFLTVLDGEKDRLRGYQLGVDDYVSKAASEDELRARVQRVLARARARPRNVAGDKALRGDLSQVRLTSLLSFLEMERRTGLLLLVSSTEMATLHVRDGRILRVDLSAEHDSKKGIERVLYVLDWMTGRFELTAAEVEIEDVLDLPTSHVLLEHARLQDEDSKFGHSDPE